jgi:hypothetical protein
MSDSERQIVKAQNALNACMKRLGFARARTNPASTIVGTHPKLLRDRKSLRRRTVSLLMLA